MLRDTFLLAFKNLKHRGVRSWLTLLGIFIGVTAVVALISLGNGLQLAVSSQFGLSQTDLITVQASGITAYGPPGSGAVTPLTTKELDDIKALSSVKRAVGRNIGSGKIEYNNNIIYGYITNVPSGPDRQFVYSQLNTGAVQGRLLQDGDVGKVFLGYNYLANKVGLGKPVEAGNNILINGKSFRVIGILEKKGSFVFDNAVYMNEADMKKLLNYGDKVDLIAAQPIDKSNMNRTVNDIEKVMRRDRHVKKGEEDFTVSTPAAALNSVNQILKGVQIFIIIVALISVFVGSLGIVNTMTASVLERKREIGIMKSIGARNGHIFLQFFIESGLLGLLGGLVGAAFGTLIGIVGTAGIDAWLGANLKMHIDLLLIFFSLLGSFLIGAVAGIVPAMRASKENPVDALRS